MKVTIEIDTDNDAFKVAGYSEILRLCKKAASVAQTLAQDLRGQIVEADKPLLDLNGNKVGFVRVSR